jgi:hypothetical protein
MRFVGQFSEGDRWASPVFFGPGTLGRTWGTRLSIPKWYETPEDAGVELWYPKDLLRGRKAPSGLVGFGAGVRRNGYARSWRAF